MTRACIDAAGAVVACPALAGPHDALLLVVAIALVIVAVGLILGTGGNR